MSKFHKPKMRCPTSGFKFKDEDEPNYPDTCEFEGCLYRLGIEDINASNKKSSFYCIRHRKINLDY